MYQDAEGGAYRVNIPGKRVSFSEDIRQCHEAGEGASGYVVTLELAGG